MGYEGGGGYTWGFTRGMLLENVVDTGVTRHAVEACCPDKAPCARLRRQLFPKVRGVFSRGIPPRMRRLHLRRRQRRTYSSSGVKTTPTPGARAHLFLELRAEGRVAACFVVRACGGFLEKVGRQRVGGLGEKRREVSVQPVSVLLDELLRCVRHLFGAFRGQKYIPRIVNVFVTW